MKAELKFIEYLEGELETYIPEHEGVYLFLTLFIGPENSQAMENFTLIVCDGKYLSNSVWEPKMGKGLMIVHHYDYQAITEKIKACIKECDTGDWDTTAVNLSRYFFWEFEDYQPYVET